MTPKQLLKYIQRIKVELAKEVGRINSKLEAINKNDRSHLKNRKKTV